MVIGVLPCYGAHCGKERTVDAMLVRLDVELLHADRVLPFLVRDGELVGTKLTIDPRNALPAEPILQALDHGKCFCDGQTGQWHLPGRL